MRNEAEMIKILRNYFEGLNFLTVQEFGVGYGVADLIAYRLAYKNCEKRVANNQKKPLDKVQYFLILDALPDIKKEGAISLKALTCKLPFSIDSLKYHWLESLRKFGYVRKVGQHLYAKVNGFIPITQEIVAVEAKLTDWKKGAIQAKRYTVFANRTYLATHKMIAHRVNAELLGRHGIGLLLVSKDGVQKVLSAPKVGPRDPLRYQLAGEIAWKAYYRKSHMETKNASQNYF